MLVIAHTNHLNIIENNDDDALNATFSYIRYLFSSNATLNGNDNASTIPFACDYACIGLMRTRMHNRIALCRRRRLSDRRAANRHMCLFNDRDNVLGDDDADDDISSSRTIDDCCVMRGRALSKRY